MQGKDVIMRLRQQTKIYVSTDFIKAKICDNLPLFWLLGWQVVFFPLILILKFSFLFSLLTSDASERGEEDCLFHRRGRESRLDSKHLDKMRYLRLVASF